MHINKLRVVAELQARDKSGYLTGICLVGPLSTGGDTEARPEQKVC